MQLYKVFTKIICLMCLKSLELFWEKNLLYACNNLQSLSGHYKNIG
jgi:hypothetical protein